CVKPVASVHPEPGSNSSLLSIFSFSFLFHNRAGKQERPSVLFFILPSQKQRRILSDLFG
ncbi:hypothetical protein, partial [uncultured Duncaniella sp.]|uniref:hypothetical protein n=1 Tax=uncultured Duncaniella sp. TaxID=2768039 RepID=UPI0025B0603A